MNQFVAIVNAQGANLAGSHLLGGLDAGLLRDGTTILPTEGYLRTVPQPNWQVVGR